VAWGWVGVGAGGRVGGRVLGCLWGRGGLCAGAWGGGEVVCGWAGWRFALANLTH
jgi:hypothetical protein